MPVKILQLINKDSGNGIFLSSKANTVNSRYD